MTTEDIYSGISAMTDEELAVSVGAHCNKVMNNLALVVRELLMRGTIHDKSKLIGREAETFKVWRPRLQAIEEAGGVDSPEMEAALAEMDAGLQDHYANNSHHPEHYRTQNGINGMSLFDLIEMCCDWHAAASERGVPVNLSFMVQRHNIDIDTERRIAEVLSLLDAG